MSKTEQERIDAIEFLRQQYMEYTNAPQRLQRVIRIVSMKDKHKDLDDVEHLENL